MIMHFKDRHEAGIKLAEQLKKYKENKEVIVLAIPRGGVEVGYEIFFKNGLVAQSFKKFDFYKFLDNKGVKWQKKPLN